MPLSDIHIGKKPSPRKIVVYGVHGIGKSTFGANADAPIFIPTEEGVNDIDCASFPLSTSFEQVMGYITDLYNEEHEFKTVVIDTLDWLEKLIWAKVCTEKNVASIDAIDFQKGYAFALRHWKRFRDGIDGLRRDRGMTALMLAHSKIERFNNPETDPYDRYSPALHKWASADIQEWATDVFFTNYKIYTRKADEHFGKSIHKATGDGSRILYTRERPSHVAKNRLDLIPDEIPLDFAELKKYFPTAQEQSNA